MWDSLWGAIAMLLVLEGLMPLIAPRRWRAVFQEVLKLNDGQLRFFGLVCVLLGALLWWLLGTS